MASGAASHPVTVSGPARLDETAVRAWGERVGRDVPTPVVIGLEGPLGAGKSVLARAIGRGAGVTEPMPSPSYNLLFRYPAGDGRTLVHLDLYRLERPDELDELGWFELPAPDELVVVEWPGRAEGRLPSDHWHIRIDPVPGASHLRSVTARPVGAHPALPLLGPDAGL